MSKDPREFITSTGIKIKIKGIPQMLIDRISASVEKPVVPKYKIVTASEEEIWEPHNETTLQTDEDRKVYHQFLEKMAAADNIVNERMFKAICMKGIEVDLPAQTEWIEMQKFLGITIPEDPLELKYLYIQTEVIGTTEDIMTITDMVMQATGVPEAALAEARKSFPGGLQEKPKPTGNGRSRKRKVDK